MHDKSLILATLPVETDLIPASTYLKLLDQCANGDAGACDIVELCKSGRAGWQKILKEADRTLTYDAKESIQDVARGGAALTPGSILDFDAIVTTTRKDRDGDILETGGAHFDPRSPLLWAHNPDLPIGKTITITTHTKNVLAGRFCIFNTELGRDAAILVEGGALRISHGFEPTEFEPLEGKNAGRWRILKFQIFEVSLVSVPSNIDAVITGFEKGKFESGIVKSWGKRLLDARPVQGIGMEFKSSHGNCSCHEGSGAAEPKGVTTFTISDQASADQIADRMLKRLSASGFMPGMKVTTGKETLEQKAADKDPIRWNKKLSKHFDTTQEHLQASQLEYDWVAKFLRCSVKEIFKNCTYIPAVRMGSWLTGLEQVTIDSRIVDTRNITYDGKEKPPHYEVVQLTAEQSTDFLIEGLRFHDSKDGRFVVKFAPSWSGIDITVYTPIDQKGHNREIIEKSWEWAKVNNFLKGQAFSLSGEFLSRDDLSFEDVFLTEKNQRPVEHMLKKLNAKGRKSANRGMIFAGPPGTGKTLTARVVKNKAEASFIWISSRDFYYMGAFSGTMYAYELAKELAPAVIVFEDVDNWISDGTIDLLKTEMDGIGRSCGIVTILTTNFPERIPEALIDRPGRFHDVLKFDLPDQKTRERMLRKWLDGVTDADLLKAVEKTDGMSGAHLFELSEYAKTIMDQDEEPMSSAIFKAIDKIHEQRELIDSFHLSGSRYKPRKEFLLRSKSMQIDTKEAPGEGQGEQQEHPEDRERFGQGAQAGDETWQPIDGPGKSLGGPEEEDSDDGDDDDDLDKDNPPPSVKAGRAISAKNRAKLEEVSGHLSYVIGMDGTHASSQCKTMIKAAKTHVDEMLSEPPEDDRGNESVGALNDPNMYDAAKLAGLLMLKADELDPEIAGSLIDALEKRMEFAANEITAELIGNL